MKTNTLINLKNLTEFILWAGGSCAIGFFTRLNPGFLFPVLMLRVGYTLYMMYMILNAKKRSMKFAYIFTGSGVTFGAVGSYWDYFEVLLKFNQGEIVYKVTVFCIVATAFFVLNHWRLSKKDEDQE